MKLTMFVRRTRSTCLAMAMLGGLLLSPGIASAVSPAECGRLENSVGPIDYRKARYMGPRGEVSTALLRDVEVNHFRPEIEALARRSTAYFGDDLDYVLRVFPNHHRALLTMQRLGEVEKTDKPRGSIYSVECYFERALRFAADDHIARGLYANYLMLAGRRDQAAQQLDRALLDAKGNAVALRNIGILFTLNGNLDKALAQARAAEELGGDISALRTMLEAKGAWKPAPAPVAASTPLPAASSTR